MSRLANAATRELPKRQYIRPIRRRSPAPPRRETQMVLNALLIAKCLACAFFAILFLQSGFDKVTDRKGNLDWLMGHFAKSPFDSVVPLLLRVLTLMELVSGFGALFGCFIVSTNGPHWIPVAAIGLCAATLLCLFAGQRIAKDYPGAVTIATYFGVSILSLYLMSIGLPA